MNIDQGGIRYARLRNRTRLSDDLTHHYAESVGVWNGYRDHILAMADTLSEGILKQFPNRFA